LIILLQFHHFGYGLCHGGRCDLSLIGVYDAAQSGYYTSNDGAKRGYPFGSANIEQGDARGEDVVNVAAFYQIVGVPWRDTAITSSSAVQTILKTPRMRTDSVYTRILAFSPSRMTPWIIPEPTRPCPGCSAPPV